MAWWCSGSNDGFENSMSCTLKNQNPVFKLTQHIHKNVSPSFKKYQLLNNIIKNN